MSLIATIVFSGTYWYTSNASLCQYPVSYRIGDFDSRFDISREEAVLAIADASRAWEEAVDTDLFIHDKTSSFTINFIFDDRQALSDEERKARDEIETLEAKTVSITRQYDELVEKHKNLQDQYNVASDEYDANLHAYNQRVAELNQRGEVTAEELETLENSKQKLEVQVVQLSQKVDHINQLASEINDLSQRGNKKVDIYNTAVAEYNELFGQSREFTQADYQGDSINIYTFANQLELRQVLAHELGHAIGLAHVDDSRSIMYHLMGTQPDELRISEYDINEFERICGGGTGWRGWLYGIKNDR